jgi:diacylglycerol kinase (ATP)
MDEPFLLVVNPRAGAGRAEKLIPDLRHSLEEGGAKFELEQTRAQGDATRIIRDALRGGMAGIAVVGGDGTLNEAVNGFFDEDGTPIAPKAWLGPLPCGTGGDFRRTLGISNRVEAMVTRMLWSKPRPIDIGWLRCHGVDGEPKQRAFINISSFGISGLVVDLVNEAPKWLGARPSFIFGLVRGLRRYENQHVMLAIGDAEPRESDVLAIVVANGRFFGGGMMIAPDAVIDDGVFEVVSLEFRVADRTVREIVDIVASLYSGEHVSKPGVSVTRAKRVSAEPAVPGARVFIDLDGESPGVLPASWEIRPGALLLRG